MVTINLDLVKEVAHVSIRRAYVFMGLGINAANSDELDDYHLPGIVQIRAIPGDPTPDQIQGFKNEFRVWVIGNAIREIIQGFEHYLRASYDVLLQVRRSQGNDIEVAPLIREFDHKGVDRRLRLLAAEFDFLIPEFVDFHGLTKARNCLTHARGYVRSQDCTEGGNLVLKWRAFDFSVDTNDGQIIEMPRDLLDPLHIEAGGRVGVRPVDRTLSFCVGERIEVSPHDLRELCSAAQMFVEQSHKNMITVLEGMGVPVIKPND